MRVNRVCAVAAVMSLVLAGTVLAGVSPDGRGGVAYTAASTGISPDGKGGVSYAATSSAQGVSQASAVSPDGQGGVVYRAPSSTGTNTDPYLNSSSTNNTMYTTNYTDTTGGYYVNGVLYNTMNLGPMAGNQAATGLAQVTNPSQMNPAGNHYSSSSTVINTRRVVANTYLKDGWQFENNGMWYLYSDGTYPVSSWRSIDGANYHFNQGGYLEVNTWIYEANGAWYYVGADAKMVRGLQNISGRLYYFEPNNGQLQGPGLLLAGGRYYYAGQDGALVQNAWIGSFFFGADGTRVN
ncbi:MAG: hypothetical protein Q4Q21_01405 [Lachnospiraceae bacterium]|nr:hypothetical protein [Lachnospiraceae bacterium]